MSSTLTVRMVYGFIFNDSQELFESEEFDGVVMDPVDATSFDDNRKVVFVKDSELSILSTLHGGVSYSPFVEVPTERNGEWHRLLIDATLRIHSKVHYPIGDFGWIVLTDNC